MSFADGDILLPRCGWIPARSGVMGRVGFHYEKSRIIDLDT